MLELTLESGGIPYALIAKALLTILLAALAARIASALQHKLRIAEGLAPIPGPKGWPLVGVLPLFIKHAHRFNDFHEEMMIKYGGRITYPWSFFADSVVCLASPEDIKHILSTNMNNYIRAPRYVASMEELFDKGMVTLNHAHTKDNGVMWRLQRKVVMRVLTTSNFKLFSEQVFSKYALQIVGKIKEQGGKCDMRTLAGEYTLQSFFDVSCGVPLVEVDDQQGRNFVESLRFVVQHISTRLVAKPYFKYFWWCMPEEYQLKREARVLTDIADKILDRRLSESEEEIASRSDIMSLFIKKARELSVEEGLTSSSPVLDLGTLRAIFLSLNWAAWDTTSSAITYTFYALALYPEVQEKLFREVSSGEGDDSGSVAYDSIKKFAYLDAVVSESMRIYTTVPTTFKLAAEDDHLPDGTFIPAGAEVMYTPWYMARHNPIWGSDPLVFRPERWLEMKTRPSAYEFPIFQAGPRICPGMNMALTETKLLVVVLLRQFHIKIQEGEQVENRGYMLSPVLTMEGGLPLLMTPRAGVETSRSS